METFVNLSVSGDDDIGAMTLKVMEEFSDGNFSADSLRSFD
jgi:hypothetical protein